MKVIRIPSYLAGLIAAVESGGLTTEQAAELAAATAHVARTDNPHGVTAAQVGAPSLALMATQDDAVLAAAVGALDAHAVAADPHTGYRKEADNHPASLVTVLATPTNYSAADDKVESHLAGIDVALASAGGGGSAIDIYWGGYSIALEGVSTTYGDPSVFDGEDGDIWLDTTGDAVWIKASGSWVEQAGAAIAYTSGSPAGGDGADDDYAVDRLTGRVYGPKASGTWPATPLGRLTVSPRLFARHQGLLTVAGNDDEEYLGITFTPPMTRLALADIRLGIGIVTASHWARCSVRQDRAAPAVGGVDPGGTPIGGSDTGVRENFRFKGAGNDVDMGPQPQGDLDTMECVGGVPTTLTVDIGSNAGSITGSIWFASLRVDVPL